MQQRNSLSPVKLVIRESLQSCGSVEPGFIYADMYWPAFFPQKSTAQENKSGQSTLPQAGIDSQCHPFFFPLPFLSCACDAAAVVFGCQYVSRVGCPSA